MRRHLHEFDEIVVVDSEFSVTLGEVQRPICIAFAELRSGRRGVVFADEVCGTGTLPFSCGANTLVVAHYASAEAATLLALGLEPPLNVLDTFVEFRVATNGDPRQPASLLAAARYFGIDAMPETKKEAMRGLALRGTHTAEELGELGTYCQEDVDTTAKVFRALVAKGLDLPRALVRGRFMLAAARTEHCGLPVDGRLASAIADHKDELAVAMVEQLDHAGLFDGVHLRQSAIQEFAHRNRLPWPRTPSGRFSTERDVIEELAPREPLLTSTVEILDLLSALRQVALPVGRDGRARTGLRPFATKTGRGAPAAKEFLLAQASWRRGLVRPEPGTALAYLDYATQELAIAAALSGDEAMWDDYCNDDPYLALATRMGRAPSGATRFTHPEVREDFKRLALGVLFSMSAYGLARRLGVGLGLAEEYLALHRRAYVHYWKWSDAIVFIAQDRGHLETSFGWRFRPSNVTSPRTLRNWPMQAHGGDILRLACILGWERGVRIVGPLHDAVLIEAPCETIEEAVAIMRDAMVAASIAVIGRPLRVSQELITADAPWVSRRARPTWDRVTSRVAPMRAR